MKREVEVVVLVFVGAREGGSRGRALVVVVRRGREKMRVLRMSILFFFPFFFAGGVVLLFGCGLTDLQWVCGM